jgi:hypothetical protein
MILWKWVRIELPTVDDGSTNKIAKSKKCPN